MPTFKYVAFLWIYGDFYDFQLKYFLEWFPPLNCFPLLIFKNTNCGGNTVRERPLMTSDIRVGRGSKIAPKMGRYRVGQGR